MNLEYAIFYTKNIDKSSKFYEEVIKLPKAFGNDNFVAFNVGNKLLGIKVATDERETPGAQTIIVSVANLNDWNKELKDAGVNFYKEITNETWGRNFAILDPDLNKIEFVEE